ncbi:MAG TPA: HAD family hydrolase [Opitutaceae bacterium]|nr:HAD family hydrolase [Opitutaceae bacterium]
MPVAAIGFDLGETLLTYAETPLDWTAHYSDALRAVGKKIGAQLTPADLSEGARVLSLYNTRRNPRRNEVSCGKIFEEIFAAWRRPAADSLEQAAEAFFGFFQQRMAAYPESPGTLAGLRTRDVRVGVLTDVPYGMPRTFVQRDLAGAKLDRLVDVLLTSRDVGWRKPEVAGFHSLAVALGVKPEELWFVGNEEKDIAGARAAGATAVLIDRSGSLAPAWGQHHTIRNLREILPLV